MKLVGPKDVVHTWMVDGKPFTAQNGTVTPVPEKHEVSQSLYAMGFHWEEDAVASKAPVPSKS